MSFALAPFKDLIKARCGLSFEGNGEQKLLQALSERSSALNLAPGDYFARLCASETEFQALVNLLTINETYFFREPEQIRFLVERLAPRFLTARAGSSPVRIFSAGCSSGEEPYSLAMALIERYGASVASSFTIVAADIDSFVLAKARLGRYSEFSFRGVPEGIRERYFDRDGASYLLRETVRRLVSFHEINLLDRALPAIFCDFDIVFFRNVSIYFDAPTRRLIQEKFAALMRDDGVLLIGSAETLANDLGVLTLREEEGIFYFTKGLATQPAERFQPGFAATAGHFSFVPEAFSAGASTEIQHEPYSSNESFNLHNSYDLNDSHDVQNGYETSAPTRLPVEPVVPQVSALVADLTAARGYIDDKHYDAALSRLDAVLTVEAHHREAALLKAHVLINRREFAAAASLATHVLAVDAWSVDAQLLLGLAAKWQQQEEAAIRHFKQAVYVCHECWPAHYYLADLYRAVGEWTLARRAYRVVLQLLSGKAPETGIRHLPLDLPVGQVRFLCEHQLDRLPGIGVPAEQG